MRFAILAIMIASPMALAGGPAGRVPDDWAFYLYGDRPSRACAESSSEDENLMP